MNLMTLRQYAKGQYGLPQNTTADALFTDAVLNAIINRKHCWIAERTRCYRKSVTKDLPIGDTATGLSTVNLGCNIIVSLPYTIRASVGGEWTELKATTEEELITAYGALRGVDLASSWAYFFRIGDQKDAHRVVEVFPGATAAVTNGFQLHAYIYPEAMTNDSHAPGIQVAETDILVPATCWGMAEVELSRGTRPDAQTVLAYWRGETEKRVRELKALIDETKSAVGREINCNVFDVMGDW